MIVSLVSKLFCRALVAESSGFSSKDRRIVVHEKAIRFLNVKLGKIGFRPPKYQTVVEVMSSFVIRSIQPDKSARLSPLGQKSAGIGETSGNNKGA